MILKRLMLAGDLLDFIFDHPETLHELVTDAFIADIKRAETASQKYALLPVPA